MLTQIARIAVGTAILFPTSVAAFRVPADAILNSYSLPDGTPVCVVMNHNNYESVPDGRGGWTWNSNPRPVAVDCRTGMVIPEEHVPIRPAIEPAPAPAEPEPTEEDRKREQCKQIREGAREGATEAHGGGIPVLEAEMIAVFACAIFL